MRDCEGSLGRDWVVFGFVETEVFVVNPYFRSSCASSNMVFPSPAHSQGVRYPDETAACGNCYATSGIKGLEAYKHKRWVLTGMEEYGS